MMEWNSFIKSCRDYFDAGRNGGMFRLVEAIDAVYRLVPEKTPFPRSQKNDEPYDSFDRVFFICHRTFLSAAMNAASSLPEDGEAITRRALEAAKTCLAIKLDPANGELWRAEHLRVHRWRERGKGQIPKSLALRYNNIQAEPLFRELQAAIGSLSDFSSHFTPEFLGRYTWADKPHPNGGFETFFGLTEGAIEFGFLLLSKHHELVLRVFDRCQDGNMLRHHEVARAFSFAYELHEHQRQLARPAVDAMLKRMKS